MAMDVDWMKDSASILNYPKGPLDIIFSQGRRNRIFLLTTLVIGSCNTASSQDTTCFPQQYTTRWVFSQLTIMAVPLIFHMNVLLTFVVSPKGNLSEEEKLN